MVNKCLGNFVHQALSIHRSGFQVIPSYQILHRYSNIDWIRLYRFSWFRKEREAPFTISSIVELCYNIVQRLWCFFTSPGASPSIAPFTISTTSSKSGNLMVFNFEWMRWSLTVTSKQDRLPTNPETSASGTACWISPASCW